MTAPGEQIPTLTPKHIQTLQHDIKVGLFKLLQKRRKQVEKLSNKSDFEWGHFEVSDLLQLTDVYKGLAIFPLFNYMSLYPENPENIKILRSNNQLLHQIGFW